MYFRTQFMIQMYSSYSSKLRKNLKTNPLPCMLFMVGFFSLIVSPSLMKVSRVSLPRSTMLGVKIVKKFCRSTFRVMLSGSRSWWCFFMCWPMEVRLLKRLELASCSFSRWIGLLREAPIYDCCGSFWQRLQCIWYMYLIYVVFRFVRVVVCAQYTLHVWADVVCWFHN